jgi:hypothetical protein
MFFLAMHFDFGGGEKSGGQWWWLAIGCAAQAAPVGLPKISNDQSLIRQFIGRPTVGREMSRQMQGNGLDTGHHGVGMIRLFECGFHFAANPPPFFVADFAMNTAIGDDFNGAVGQQQVNQQAVIGFGVPDSQLREDIDRPLGSRLAFE